MPDTPVESPGGGPYDPRLETRVSRLEDQMSDLKPILTRIDAILPHLATAAQLAELRGDIDVKLARTDAKIERLTGRVEALPTTWQMITAIVSGQVALASLLCAAVFGAGRLTGHW